MTLEEYEERFYGELFDNYDGQLAWNDYIKRCYSEFMALLAEQELEMELNGL